MQEGGVKCMKIAASVLASDFARLGEEVERVSRSGADFVHIDVMDGVFVRNITMGPDIIRAIRPYTSVPFDVHLMITEPSRYFADFAEAGADIITFHAEAGSNLLSAINAVKSTGKRVGVAIKPATLVDELLEYLPMIDLAVVMTVEPGFGGQAFMPEMMGKVRALREEICKQGLRTLIEVDGGINKETAKVAAQSGADICVAGTSIFKSSDMKRAIAEIKGV